MCMPSFSKHLQLPYCDTVEDQALSVGVHIASILTSLSVFAGFHGQVFPSTDSHSL